MRITVVTVCLNSARVIEPTIQSVLAQDYPDLEYLVIDGGSTDDTPRIAQRYADRITKLVSEPDRGVYDAMNKGLALASGEYVLFMNAGDVFAAPDVLTRAAAFAGADVIYGDYLYSEGPRKGRVSADLARGIGNHQCILYRRALHADFGPYLVARGLTASDYLFLMSMVESGRVSLRKIDLVFAIVDPNGMSSGLQTFLQVNLMDGLLGRRGRYAIALRIALHPFYDALRRLVRRFL